MLLSGNACFTDSGAKTRSGAVGAAGGQRVSEERVRGLPAVARAVRRR